MYHNMQPHIAHAQQKCVRWFWSLLCADAGSRWRHLAIQQLVCEVGCVLEHLLNV